MGPASSVLRTRVFEVTALVTRGTTWAQALAKARAHARYVQGVILVWCGLDMIHDRSYDCHECLRRSASPPSGAHASRLWLEFLYFTFFAMLFGGRKVRSRNAVPIMVGDGRKQ